MKIIQIFIYILLFLFSASMTYSQCVPASTAAGAIDTCFGTNGKVITDITADRDYSRALALQSDGKIVVAGISGYSATAGNADFTLVRYNTDGSLDTTFDGDGIVRTDFSAWTENDDDYCRGLAIQPDGKIIVGGRSYVTPTTYALVAMRYNTDGSLDTTFDGDGKAQFEMAAIIEMYAFALQPDGKILVGGRAYNFSTGSFTGVLARFNSNGSLDTSFGTNGSTTASMSGIFSIAYLLDGRIIAAGTTGPDSSAAMTVSRLNANGSLDTSFGTGGVVTHHPTVSDQTWFVKIRYNGQIFIGGHSTAAQSSAAARLASFSSDGTLLESISDSAQTAFWNMTFQPDGKALVVGASNVPPSGFSIRRFLEIHTPDTSFNGGIVTVKFLPDAVPEASGVNAITMTRDNKIIVAGSVTEQNNQTTGWRWAITRLYSGLPTTHTPFDFDGDSKSDLSIFRPSVGEWWYYKSSDGGNYAAQFGISSDRLTPGDFTGDGRSDFAFWRPSTGEWFVLRSENATYYSYPFGASGDVPQVGDFDADGKADTAVFRPSSATWFIRRSSDGGATIQSFGAAGDIPVAADYDGDGRSDLAIFRPSSGQWWLNRSTTGTIVFTFGTSTDKLVPGDYTGDSKTDVAFFRPSTSEWFVLRSEDQSYYSFPFGTTNDIPSPGDYDGDAKFDAAVFRPSNSTWFVQRTTAGTLIQTFGQTGDLPVPNAFVP